MDAAQTGGGRLVSGAPTAGFTYAEYWQTLMATAEHTGHPLHADASHEPVPSLKSPTPTPPPPSRRVPPGRQNTAAATVATRAPPSHLTEAGTYRLHLALTPSPHQAKRSPLPQHQEPLHTTTMMSNHVGERERRERIAGEMRTGKEAFAPAGQSIRKPSTARKSPPPAARAGSRAPPSSSLDTSDYLSDKDAGAARATDLLREQWAHATVIGGTRRVGGSTIGDQRDSSAPSGDKDLVDSPRQHSSAADNTSAQHAFSLTAGAALVDAVYAYTPDDLVVKAAQCYEQWRRCVMEGSIDTDDDDDDSTRECRFSGEGSPMAGEGEKGDAEHRISPPDGPAREDAESPGAAAPDYTPSALSRTPTNDRRGALNPGRGKVRPEGKALFSPACTRGKQTPFRADGTQSRTHSTGTTTHGLTSGRRDRDGDTDSTITAPVALASLFTCMDASPVSKSPSPHVAPPAPTIFRSVRALDEKVAERLTVEDEVEEPGPDSHGALRPSQQHHHHQHPLIQARHCLHQRAERIPEMDTRASRPEPTHRTYMSKDVRTVDEASGSLQSFSVAESDVDDAHSPAPLSVVYRRLFADEVEDCGGGVTTWRDVADTRHRERGGATNADGALSLSAPSSGTEGQERFPAGALDVPAECHTEVARRMSSDAAHNLTTLAEVDHVRETLIELSSSCSSVEDRSDPVGGAELSGNEIPSHTEANLHQGASNSSHSTPSLSGSRSNLSLPRASRLSLPTSVWPVDKDKRNGPDRAELTDSEAQVPPAVAARPLLYRDHPLWCKHHASVSMLYASRLLPSEQANDELQLFLCWAQEKGERQSQWRQQQHHHNGDTGGSSETVVETSELGASPHVSCAAAEVYKVAYAMARRGKWAGAPLSPVQRGSVSGNSERDAAVGASPAGFASAPPTSPTLQQTPPLPRPMVFVAAPLQTSDAAWSPSPADDVDWTVTPSAAPSRFVEWIATEVDPYESLLFSPL
ncbi:conserved hypothetical protein [Leishmania mexicana MHOM/GT/2001/U1103]|uniref:Uncharacterized protein n=1 Tax=Leishmania mexicana (strain MHOM/GT/2001/U1103) TaxID=929439 RepID=E9AS82_LEIMU|nr:conserved hypothetical protein [Leishmania mexicana MHOM/GT/2001/U1103]CBZ25803.1 conserved hypothetical protein [Leishmania mexicana MHOM/GT/2001/U1103]